VNKKAAKAKADRLFSLLRDVALNFPPQDPFEVIERLENA
jgi:hypothetical protein